MIDSRGDSRIMDFGLALAAGEDDGDDLRHAGIHGAGTDQRRNGLRRRSLAAIGLGLLMMTGFLAALREIKIAPILINAMLVYVTARFGLLAIAVAQAAFSSLFHFPLFASESWQSIQLLPVMFVLAFAVWAFYTSLGGQSPFSASLLDE